MKRKWSSYILALSHPSHVLQKKLSSGDLVGAVEELENSAKENRRTPYKREVMQAVLNSSEGNSTELLQRILDAASSCVGEEAALYDLAFSFVSEGKDGQAGKLLATPGLAYRKEKIDWFFSTGGTLRDQPKDLKRLVSIARLTRPLFGADRNHIYTLLVER